MFQQATAYQELLGFSWWSEQGAQVRYRVKLERSPSPIGKAVDEVHRLRIAYMKHQVTPEYLSLTELAIYASVSKNTLKKWLKHGMPFFQVDRCLRVRIGEFNDWMNRFRGGTSQDLDAMLDQVIQEVKQ